MRIACLFVNYEEEAVPGRVRKLTNTAKRQQILIKNKNTHFSLLMKIEKMFEVASKFFETNLIRRTQLLVIGGCDCDELFLRRVASVKYHTDITHFELIFKITAT